MMIEIVMMTIIIFMIMLLLPVIINCTLAKHWDDNDTNVKRETDTWIES